MLPTRSSSTSSHRRLGCLGVVVILGQLGCHHAQHHGKKKPRLQVTTPMKKDTQITKEYVCQIRAIRHIELRALEKGYLAGIFVDEGQFVKQGQLMFQIMPRLYRAEYRKAKAEAEFARIEYENTKLLVNKKVVSPNELALANAKLNKAKAEMERAKAHLGLTEIRAPFEGIMDRLKVRQGSLVSEGEPLTTLSDTRQMWVYFNVTEADYLDYKSRPKTEEKATVSLVLANNQLFEHTGKIETIEAEFNNETGNIAFRATFPNPAGLLRHGQTGKVLMNVPVKNALLIPQKATFELLTKKYVFVVDEKNVVRQRQISVAHELPHLYVVGKGLAENERILLEGLRRVQHGDQIAVDYRKPAEVMAHLEVPAE